jgi:hypothetical protein
MITTKDFPKQKFQNKSELIKALKANKELLISEKKAQIIKSCERGVTVCADQKKINKALEQTKTFSVDSNYYYFVVNSSNILDSHNDMHIEGNWEKSVKEQQGKLYLVFDHTLKRTEIVAMKEDIEVFTATIPFSAIGKSYEGNTYCLIYKIKKDKIYNEEARKMLEAGYSFEMSVRMQYMDIDLAYDSEAKEDAKEKANFDKYYPQIANKDELEEIYYFWIVKQARNVKESSFVMFGSNPATGEMNTEAVTDTSAKTAEPSDDTQAKELLKELLNKF